MPPIKKIQREDIISCALDLLKKEDITSLNARRIAHELNVSVQPIFYNFTSMEDLKKEVYDEVYRIYQNYMKEGSKAPNSYKGMGLSYIRFARDYPNYFRLIFMQETTMSPESLITNDSMGNDVIQKGMELTGFSYEEQKDFHVRVWIFTHGLATLVATNTICIQDEEIESLLESTVREMIIGRKNVKNGKYN